MGLPRAKAGGGPLSPTLTDAFSLEVLAQTPDPGVGRPQPHPEEQRNQPGKTPRSGRGPRQPAMTRAPDRTPCLGAAPPPPAPASGLRADPDPQGAPIPGSQTWDGAPSPGPPRTASSPGGSARAGAPPHAVSCARRFVPRRGVRPAKACRLPGGGPRCQCAPDCAGPPDACRFAARMAPPTASSASCVPARCRGHRLFFSFFFWLTNSRNLFLTV